MKLKEKEELIEKFKQLAIRKLLAGYDCLENRNQKPLDYLLGKTDYYYEAVGIVQSIMVLTEGNTHYAFEQIFSELKLKALEMCKTHGCKAAYQIFIGRQPESYCQTFDWLMENGVDPTTKVSAKEVFGINFIDKLKKFKI